jgi:hypothetical protein
MICLSAEDNAENHQDVLFLIGRTGVASGGGGRGHARASAFSFLGGLDSLALEGLSSTRPSERNTSVLDLNLVPLGAW